MNIDRQLVARAYDKAGEEPITDQEWEEGTGTRVRLIKDVYLASILEALSNTDWTCQKVRKRLDYSEDEENLTTFQYMYDLPADCAKPTALSNDAVYLVEGGYLYTDTKDAVLVYISNNFTGRYNFELADPQPESQEEIDDGEFYTKDEDGYNKTVTYDEEETYYVRIEEDYNFYKDFHFDPLLTEYIETVLAMKIVLKLTGDSNKYQMLFSEARLMETRAIKASVAHGHNKDKGNPYWGDMLGLPNYGGN